jgi:hypothetical protein
VSELACIVTARAGSTLLKKQASSLTLVNDEPCGWSITLDNRDQDYNPSAAIANPRTFSEVCSLKYDDESDVWNSPDLVLEDYSYNTNQVTISGRCRLAQLDREDQQIDAGGGISTFENTTVATLVAAIVSPYGLTISGAPSRAVRMFNAVGNPLQMLRDLLGPTHTFRMGAGTQIVVESISSNSSGPDYTDDEDLEVLEFRRTSDLYNKATVERVTPTGGRITLVDEQKSQDGSENIFADQEVSLSEPSRVFTIEEAFGERGELLGFQLWNGESSVGAVPFLNRTYVGITQVTRITFTYTLNVGHEEQGPYTPNWSIKVRGYPLSVDPVPTTGYSQTRTAGAGDRPYPEPFTSLAIENNTDAGSAASALVDIGGRQGNSLRMSTRLRPTHIPWPNQSIGIEDAHSEIDAEFVVAMVGITEDQNGDTGTITAEATQSEAA